jgi:uncharacterized protein
MIDDAFVIDATVHGFNFLPDNYRADFLADLVQMLYNGAHVGFHPHNEPHWNMSWHEFLHAFNYQPDLLVQTMFAESQTDLIVYHGVPLNGIYKDGSSPISVAKAARERCPGRVFIYGPLYPWQPDALDELERMAEEDGIIGLKFYPIDLYGDELRPSRMDDAQMWAICERARSLGIRMIAVHKAVPLGPLPLAPYNSLYDLAPIVADFPDLTFEIVHGGAAFLSETIAMLERFPNVVVNLESLPMFIPNHRQKWVEIMAAYLAAGLADRLFYATGAVGGHPQPFLKAFWEFEMPAGMPQISSQQKRDILANNYARYLGWDLDKLKAQFANDQFGLQRTALARPWSAMRPLAA